MDLREICQFYSNYLTAGVHLSFYCWHEGRLLKNATSNCLSTPRQAVPEKWWCHRNWEKRSLQVSTIWKILRKGLKLKVYQPLKVNSTDHLEFEMWFLQQPEGFELKVIWSDEKWFCLHPAPNSQTNRIWAPANPEEEVVCNFQGVTKVMAWVRIVDGRVFKVRWMQYDEGCIVSVNGERYLKMIKDVWPELRGRARCNRYWWQQYGATSHMTRDVLRFLLDKFASCVISRHSEIF